MRIQELPVAPAVLVHRGLLPYMLACATASGSRAFKTLQVSQVSLWIIYRALNL